MSSVCDVCSETLPSAEALRRHRSNRHSTFPPLFIAGKAYAVEFKDEKFHCPMEACRKAYLNRDSMVKHLKDSHGAAFEAASCVAGTSVVGPMPEEEHLQAGRRCLSSSYLCMPADLFRPIHPEAKGSSHCNTDPVSSGSKGGGPCFQCGMGFSDL